MSRFLVKPLDGSTWQDFARLVEKHNGVWGGCWCMGFHIQGPEPKPHPPHRGQKERRVREGRAHAALVYDGSAAVGWCQFGPTEELPGIKHKREYDKDSPPPPDWRITCFYVDRKHRGEGIALAALEGALDQIAAAGGGVVEAIPEVTDGREAQGRFLFSATVELFEQYGFRRVRRVGKHAWIVSAEVAPA